MGIFGLFSDSKEDLKKELQQLQDEKKRTTEYYNGVIANAYNAPAHKKKMKETKATRLHNIQNKIDSCKDKIARCKR